MFATFEQRQTFKALDTYRKNAFRLSDYQLKQDRYIIFSDAHAGDRRKVVDEFQHNEGLYCHALRYYLDQDYGLILNGDMEEGWKNTYHDIISAYESSTYALESEFARQGERRHLRIWGNHDADWADHRLVKTHLAPVLKRPVQVHPAVILGDRMIITHGHQGDPNADYMARFSQMVVRYLWQPLQWVFNLERRVISDFNVAWRRREHHLYEWARQRQMLLIAGHTHRPMFHEVGNVNSLTLLRDNLSHQLNLVTDQYRRYLLQAALDYVNRLIDAVGTGEEPPLHEVEPEVVRSLPRMTPCYLNSGSCLSNEGITGIEIDRGEVRLIKWVNVPQGQPERSIYQSGQIDRMLASI